MADDNEQSATTQRDPVAFGGDPARPGSTQPQTERGESTPVPYAHRDPVGSETLTFSAVVGRQPETLDSPPAPKPAREVDMQELNARRQVSPRFGAKADVDNTTLQSMIRPDLMGHGLSDPRRFLSIERELADASASVRFLEKRLHRVERDGRIVLGLATAALILAVLGFVL